tara:strand:+ start:437 stop:781 length:345 start_codon:yes stop_codon:yes gene_type:complete
VLTTIQQLKKNHQNFDVIWNKIGTAVQEDLVKTAPELLTALGAWYNRSNELIFELEDQIEQNALLDSAGVVLGDDIEDIEEEDEDEEFDDFDEEIDEPQNDDHNSPRPGIAVNL